jgi:hypothetical protein
MIMMPNFSNAQHQRSVHGSSIRVLQLRWVLVHQWLRAAFLSEISVFHTF